jgi:uncharacterized protein YkwD
MKLQLTGLCLLLFITGFAQTDYSSVSKDIFTATNEYRRLKGLAVLKWNDTISKIAEQHSMDMAKGKVKPGHDGFEKRNKLLTGKLGKPITMGENIAVNVLSGEQVVDRWKKSKPHNENLLWDFEYIGIGAAADKNGTLYVTQIFVR